MKPLYAALASVFLLGVLGCANEGPTGEELGEQFSRGMRGEGQVTPDIDRTNDPYVKPREGRPEPRG
jgi:hypothetical protein